MYRQSTLRLPCVECGTEEAVTRMTLAPRGGHWCWRCQMAAQIDEHSPSGIGEPAFARWLKRERLLRFALYALVGIIGVVLVALGLLALGRVRLP